MNSDNMSTQPTIESLFEYLKEMEGRLIGSNNELNLGLTQLRADMNAGFRKVERKMEILNDVLLDIQAQLRDHE